MSRTLATLWGEVTRGDCTSGWQRMDLVMPGSGAFARVGCLMVLEAGELGAWGNGKVLECIELPTLTSWLLMVLEWLEVNASSPLREVVFLLPWWLAGVLLHVWDPTVMLMGSRKVTFLQSSTCCWGVLDCYLVYSVGGYQVGDLKWNYTQPLQCSIGEVDVRVSGIFKDVKPNRVHPRHFHMCNFYYKVT